MLSYWSVITLRISITIDTGRVFGPEATAFFRDQGQHLRAQPGDPLAYSYLEQQIAVAVQRGNTAAVLGTAKLSIYPFCSSLTLNIVFTHRTFGPVVLVVSVLFLFELDKNHLVCFM